MPKRVNLNEEIPQLSMMGFVYACLHIVQRDPIPSIFSSRSISSRKLLCFHLDQHIIVLAPMLTDCRSQRPYSTGRKLRLGIPVGLDAEMENRLEHTACLRCMRPAEWIPSQTVFCKTVLCSSEHNKEYIQGTTNCFGPRRVMRYTKKECYVKAITSPYFATKNRSRYSTKTIVESRVALREKITQNGPTKPSMQHARPARLTNDIKKYTDFGRQLKITDYMPHCKNCTRFRVRREETTGSFGGYLHARPWEPVIRKEPLNRQVTPMDPFDFTYCI